MKNRRSPPSFKIPQRPVDQDLAQHGQLADHHNRIAVPAFHLRHQLSHQSFDQRQILAGVIEHRDRIGVRLDLENAGHRVNQSRGWHASAGRRLSCGGGRALVGSVGICRHGIFS